jgi:hypothetical protein
MCQICKSHDHIATTCPHIGDLKPKCAKCGLLHDTKLCGVRCGYWFGMGYIKERCWKCEKDVKTSFASNNYLKVLVVMMKPHWNSSTSCVLLNMMCFQGPNYPEDVFLWN